MTRRTLLLIVSLAAGCAEQSRPEPSPQPVATASPDPAAPAVAAEPAVADAASRDVEAFIPMLLAEQLGIERSRIVMDRPIAGPPLGADELDLVEIVMEIEDHFDVTLSDEELVKIAGGTETEMPTRITPSHLVKLTKDAVKRAGGRAKERD